MDVCERVNSSERRLFIEQITTVVALGCGRKVDAMWHVPHWSFIGVRETWGMRVYAAMNMVQSCCFLCRTNTLKLRWRQGFEGGAVNCLLCGGEEETARYFVTECQKRQNIRRQHGVYGTKPQEEVLMFMEKNEEKVNRCKKMLKET